MEGTSLIPTFSNYTQTRVWNETLISKMVQKCTHDEKLQKRTSTGPLSPPRSVTLSSHICFLSPLTSASLYLPNYQIPCISSHHILLLSCNVTFASSKYASSDSDSEMTLYFTITVFCFVYFMFFKRNDGCLCATGCNSDASVSEFSKKKNLESLATGEQLSQNCKGVKSRWLSRKMRQWTASDVVSVLS